MSEIQHSGRLPPKVRELYLPYAKKLLALHDGNVLALFVYGSATGANFIPGVSDVNSALVVRRLDFDLLRRSVKLVSSGIRRKIAAPLFLTVEYMRSSADVFPMEFLEMKENHVLLYGEDVLKGLEVDTAYVRLFCEQQIKGKLLRIRQAYLEIGGHHKGLESLLKTSLTALVPVFRNLVRIKGDVPQVDKPAVIRQVCMHFGLEESVLIAIYNDKENDERIAGERAGTFIRRYLDELAKLAEAVDRL